jgi:hypothetical protein
MKALRPISIVVCLLTPAAGAVAQIQLTPQPAAAAPKASKAAKPAKAKILKPAAKKTGPAATPATPQLPSSATAPVADDPNADVVFGAYQRGQYKTAFDLATKRAENGDPKAMAMLGELHAGGLGVKRASVDAAVRSTARTARNCWRLAQNSAVRRRPIIWRCSISTARRCRRT